jgi:hypothetical protein
MPPKKTKQVTEKRRSVSPADRKYTRRARNIPTHLTAIPISNGLETTIRALGTVMPTGITLVSGPRGPRGPPSPNYRGFPEGSAFYPGPSESPRAFIVVEKPKKEESSSWCTIM